jgi:hypothetical protein
MSIIIIIFAAILSKYQKRFKIRFKEEKFVSKKEKFFQIMQIQKKKK